MQKAKAVKKTIVKARLPKAVREKKPKKSKAPSVEAKAAAQGPVDDLEGLGMAELMRKAEEFAAEKNFVLGPVYMRCAMKAAAFVLMNMTQKNAEEKKRMADKQDIFDPIMIEANALLKEWRHWDLQMRLDLADVPDSITQQEADDIVREKLRTGRAKLARMKDLLQRADDV